MVGDGPPAISVSSSGAIDDLLGRRFGLGEEIGDPDVERREHLADTDTEGLTRSASIIEIVALETPAAAGESAPAQAAPDAQPASASAR